MSDSAVTSLPRTTRATPLVCKYMESVTKPGKQWSPLTPFFVRPILTYEGRACTKKGIKADRHGIIFSHGMRPRLVKDEPQLGFDPVRMLIQAEGEKLFDTSRVNYSKLMTIEHNVKVFFIGRIAPNDLDRFSDAIETCWYKKKDAGRSKKSSRW